MENLTNPITKDSSVFLFTDMNENAEQWLKVVDVAKMLSVSTVTIHRMIQRGELIGHKIGKLVKFQPTEIEEYLKNIRIDQKKDLLQILYYTEGVIYGVCRCCPKHSTREDAQQCIKQYKQKEHGLKEIRRIVELMPGKQMSNYLGFGDYEIPGSGANAMLHARSFLMRSIYALRKCVLVDLEENCFSVFNRLYPDFLEILRDTSAAKSIRQGLCASWSLKELEDEFNECKSFYNFPDLSFPKFLRILSAQQLTGAKEEEIIWELKPPKYEKKQPLEIQTENEVSKSRTGFHYIPKTIEDDLYYWETLKLAATIYYKDNKDISDLYNKLTHWATKWKLADIGDWLLDRAIETLIRWWRDDQARKEDSKAEKVLNWHYYQYILGTHLVKPQDYHFSLEDVGWCPTEESEANFTYHIKEKFNKYLAQYIQSIHILTKDRGLQKVPKLRKTTPEDHFKWFVKHIIPNEQGCTLSYEEIAQQEQEQKPLKRSTIAKGVDNANRLLLGLTLEND